MAKSPPDRARRGILMLFALLFGAGILVYSVADGRPSAARLPWTKDRMGMIDEQLSARGIRNERVLAAMRKVPRHRFVPEPHREDAYADRALPIGHRQTISQPYIVAAMTELLDVQPGDRVLEVGTGSGYQAAVLAELGAEVYSIEIVPELGERARRLLADLGYDAVHVMVGDGHQGWPDEGPFDGIIVTAAPEKIPPPLLEQLKETARLVIPVGGRTQKLQVIQRNPEGGVSVEDKFSVLFVPMTGRTEEDS